MTKKLISFLGVFLFLNAPFSLIFAENELSRIIVSGSSASDDTQLEDVPGSVSVLDEYQLTSAATDYFQNQILQVPNLNYSAGSSRPRFFQIRGIGELEQYEGAPNSSVAVIVDDVDLTGIGAALTLFDVSQLEVHRGPQAVRFGSSALAGALYFNNVAPGAETNGQILGSFGNDSLHSGGAAFSTSLRGDLFLRVTAHAHHQDGFRDNNFFDATDTNERNEYLGRAQLRYQPSEDTQVTLSLQNTKLDNAYDAFTVFNGFDTQSDRPGDDVETLHLASLKAATKLSSDTSLTSITSFYKWKQDYSFDGDWGSNSFWAPFDPYDFFSDSDRKRETYAQQFRLNTRVDQVDYLFGLYFQSLDEETVTREFADDFQYDFLSSDYEAKTYAGFTNAVIPLSDNWDLSLGGRIEYRDSEYDDSRGENFSPDDTMLGGQASLQYSSSQTNKWYFLASRGFRGGGFNASPSLTGDQREYDSESLVNLELGNYSTFLGGDLSTSLSLFVNFRRDQQIKLAKQIDPNDPLSFVFLTENAAKGRSYGLESEVRYTPTSKWLLNFSGSVMDSEITSVDDASLVSLEGRAQSHAPNWQYYLGGEYFLTDNLSIELGLAGRGGFYFDDSHNEKSDDYHLLNAAINYIVGDWEFSLWGRNLNDQKYAVRGFFFGNEPPTFPNTKYVQLGDPLSVGLTARYRF